MLIKDHCLLFIYQKNAMRIDCRKDLTVVLSGWFPVFFFFFGGKVCFPLVFFLLLLFPRQLDARPLRPRSPDDGPLCLFVFSSVYLHPSVASFSPLPSEKFTRTSVFSRTPARVARYSFLVTHKNEFHLSLRSTSLRLDVIG